MNTSSQRDQHTVEDAAALPTAPEQDPAGTISLARRNLACARTRALAGLTLGSGLVITLSSLHTTVSVPG
ncbi:hypothetical protein ACFVWX_33475 [Streptomyces sp. NPDC058220]|uniref:hypothetical protein n=1 Tax=unclassified Streptomyces TaxID=2593676 RepID=UPI00365CC9B3